MLPPAKGGKGECRPSGVARQLDVERKNGLLNLIDMRRYYNKDMVDDRRHTFQLSKVLK